VEAGETLSAAVQHSGRFSHELQQVFCWADRDENFADGLQHAGDLLNLQNRVQSHALSVFCEPVTTIVIGAIVALTVLALFMPLVKLMNDLS
jgi:type II secretory pathway component PulF